MKLVNISAAILMAAQLLSSMATAQEVNVYSARKEALIKPMLDKFTAQTGIKINLLTGNADTLISRIQTEGKLSPVDLLISTDVGRLVRAESLGLTQEYVSENANKWVAEELKDNNSQWVALTLRARPIMYAPNRVSENELSDLEALADAKWKGRICIRSSGNIYNQSLVASLIELNGEDATLTWAKSFVKNFARPPKGGDRDQIKAVAAGQCDIAIANTYYLAGMLDSDDKEQQSQAKKVKVFWPNQSNTGAHVNISGAAVAKHAKHPELANQLIDFMLTEESQIWYAQTNHEYPVKNDVSWSNTLKNMGTFKAQQVPLHKVGEGNASALKLMDNADWK